MTKKVYSYWWNQNGFPSKSGNHAKRKSTYLTISPTKNCDFYNSSCGWRIYFFARPVSQAITALFKWVCGLYLVEISHLLIIHGDPSRFFFPNKKFRWKREWKRSKNKVHFSSVFSVQCNVNISQQICSRLYKLLEYKGLRAPTTLKQLVTPL